MTDSWEREATVATPEQCRQLWHDQIPFQVADPTGPLVEQLIAEDEIVFRPEVLRHFATGGEYGMEDLREPLRRVEVPTLVLAGRHDRTTAATSAHELAQLLPNCEEVVFERSAHMIPAEEPEAFVSAVSSFLERV